MKKKCLVCKERKDLKENGLCFGCEDLRLLRIEEYDDEPFNKPKED